MQSTTTPLNWQLRRFAFYATLAVYFGAIAFYFGPNYFLFGKLTGLTPGDFVDVAKSRNLIIRAMKQYERDHGRRPDQAEDLVPAYLKEVSPWNRGSLFKGEYSTYSLLNHRVAYNFDPSHEGWYVDGLFAYGRIPVEPVTLEPVPSSAPEHHVLP